MYHKCVISAQVQRGAAPALHILRKKGSFFKTSACPRFVKEGYFFVPWYEVWGGENPLTIHKMFVALMTSDFRSDWASKSAAAKQAEDYKI